MTAKLVIVAGAICAGLLTANAAEKIQAGPRGGRILEKTTPKAEFLVHKDRTVSISFYDAADKPIAPAGQAASVIAETKGGRQKIEFEKADGSLVSKTKLPEGDANNVVVQLKQTPDAKPQNFRFKADLSTCGGCQRPEYACTCAE